MKTFLTTILFLITLPALAAEFAISPMLIDIDGKPGSKQSFSFQVHGKKAGNVRIYFSHMEQQATGHMDFKSLTTVDHEFVSWISLDKQAFDVNEGETISVEGVVEIPQRTTGNRLVAIMVEEEKKEERQGININVRYAIILNMNIDGRRIRPAGDFNELAIEEQNGKYFVSGWFQNTSDTDAQLESQVYVRDASMKLVEKVSLKTQSAWQRGDVTSLVYPSGKVKLYGLIQKPLINGDYKLTARNRFGGKMQRNVEVTQSFQAVINPDAPQAQPQQSETEVRIAPNPIVLKPQSNGGGFGMVRILNPLDQPVTISFPEVNEKLGTNFRFSPNSLELAAGGSGMVTLRQQALPDGVTEIQYRATIKGSAQQEWLDIRTTF